MSQSPEPPDSGGRPSLADASPRRLDPHNEASMRAQVHHAYYRDQDVTLPALWVDAALNELEWLRGEYERLQAHKVASDDLAAYAFGLGGGFIDDDEVPE